MNRVKFLEEGITLTQGARRETYGDFVSNMGVFAELLEGYFRARGWITAATVGNVTAEDAAHIMVLAKQARALQGLNFNLPPHADNYTDGAVYFAAAGECAFEEREE